MWRPAVRDGAMDQERPLQSFLFLHGMWMELGQLWTKMSFKTISQKASRILSASMKLRLTKQLSIKEKFKSKAIMVIGISVNALLVIRELPFFQNISQSRPWRICQKNNIHNKEEFWPCSSKISSLWQPTFLIQARSLIGWTIAWTIMTNVSRNTLKSLKRKKQLFSAETLMFATSKSTSPAQKETKRQLGSQGSNVSLLQNF